MIWDFPTSLKFQFIWDHKVVTSHLCCFMVWGQEAGLTCVTMNIQLMKMVVWSEFRAVLQCLGCHQAFSALCCSVLVVLSAWSAFLRLALVWLHFTHKVSNLMPLFQRDLSNTLFKSSTAFWHSPSY